jgi:hypothetical protein
VGVSATYWNGVLRWMEEQALCNACKFKAPVAGDGDRLRRATASGLHRQKTQGSNPECKWPLGV